MAPSTPAPAESCTRPRTASPAPLALTPTRIGRIARIRIPPLARRADSSMRASPTADLRQRNSAGAALASLVLAAVSCATPAPPAPPALELPAPAGGLRVERHFGAEADLDLYVTDPLQETVYFANSPTRRGGRLEQDLRCDAATPRSEVVVFES